MLGQVRRLGSETVNPAHFTRSMRLSGGKQPEKLCRVLTMLQLWSRSFPACVPNFQREIHKPWSLSEAGRTFHKSPFCV